ncbi:MAG: hypothetical protein ACXABG_02935 [Promethearchaeota archaeon]
MRSKEGIKIAIYSIVLVAYLIGFGAIFNIKQIMGIGYYQGSKDFTTPYSAGTGGVTVEIYALHLGYNDHNYGIKITAFSNPDSHLVGISYLDYRIATTVTKQVQEINYSAPVSTYSIGYSPPMRTTLFQNNNLTCKGFAGVIFRVNDIDEIHRIRLDFGIIIKLDGEQINYELGNLLTWINVIYLSFTAIPIIFLHRSVKNFRFLKWYSEEMRERDKDFVQKMREKKREIQAKN